MEGLFLLGLFSCDGGIPLLSSQVEFVSHLLSLLKTHLGLVAPLGFSCVQVACGQQVKPIRNLLLQLIDSQLPTELDKASVYKDYFVMKTTF